MGGRPHRCDRCVTHSHDRRIVPTVESDHQTTVSHRSRSAAVVLAGDWVGVKNEQEPDPFNPDWDLIGVFYRYVRGGYMAGKIERMSAEALNKERNADEAKSRFVRQAPEAARGAGDGTSPPVLLDVENKALGWTLNRHARSQAHRAAKHLMSLPEHERLAELPAVVDSRMPGGWFFVYSELDPVNAMRLVSKPFRTWLSEALTSSRSLE
jgi:hypothetical protein